MLKKALIAIFAMALFVLPGAIHAQEYDITQFTEDSLGSTYDYSAYSDLTDEDLAALGSAAGALGVLGGTMAIVASIVGGIVGLISYIYYALALSTIAKKLNVENEWWAWVPILNLVLMAKIAEMNAALLLLILIPGVNAFFLLYFMAVVYMKICEKRGLDKYVGLLIFVPIANIVLPGYLAWANITPKAKA